MANRREKRWKQWQIYLLGLQKSLWTVIAAMKLKDTCSLEEELPFNDKPRQHIKKQRHHFADKVLYSQSCGFSSSHVQMWELDHKEGWALKNWCFWIMVLEKSLESLLDYKDTKPVNPKGNEAYIFIGSTEAEASILWPWCKESASWKRLWCWERQKAKREGGGRGWDS